MYGSETSLVDLLQMYVDLMGNAVASLQSNLITHFTYSAHVEVYHRDVPSYIVAGQAGRSIPESPQFPAA